MLKRFLITVIASLVVTVICTILDIPYTDRLSLVLYAICGIFFSVSMSQIMVFEFSKIEDERYFQTLTAASKRSRAWLVIQFVYASIAFLGLEMINENNALNIVLSIKKYSFSLERFLIIILVYCLFYFLYNFHRLSEAKLELDAAIRKETMEE
jgi:phosphatidylglycerophosphate synthase